MKVFIVLCAEKVWGINFLGDCRVFSLKKEKYHMDGHRNCGVMLDPHESKMRGGICPVCGKTINHWCFIPRVLELADRENPVQPKGTTGIFFACTTARINFRSSRSRS